MQTEEETPTATTPRILCQPSRKPNDATHQFKTALPLTTNEIFFGWFAKTNERIAAALDNANIPIKGLDCISLPPLGFIDVERATSAFWKVIHNCVYKSLSEYFSSPAFLATVHRRTSQNRIFPPENSFFAVIPTRVYRPFLIKDIRCIIRRSYMIGEEWDLEIYCTRQSYCYNSSVQKHLIDHPEVEFEASLDTVLNQIAKLYPGLKRKKMTYEPGRFSAGRQPQLIQQEYYSDISGSDDDNEYDYSSSSDSAEEESSDSSSE